MRFCKAISIVMLVGASIPSFAAPLSTALTYQGNLSDSGGLANAPYDFGFQLWDALENGSQVGPTVTADDVNVAAGIFTVDMDFGSAPFVGDDLWLLIRVRLGSSVGGYTELSPRQALTPAPFALHAEFVPAGSISSLEIDSASVQARVTNSCPGGQYMRVIDASGGVVCEIDADTTYAAGSGLSLSGSTFSSDVTGPISLRPPSTNGSNIGSQTAEWLGFRFRIIPEAGGQGANDGRLEFSPNGGVTWGTVCDDSFLSQNSAARVVCRSMGYADGVPRANTSTTDGTGTVMLDDFSCHDSARTLLECRIKPIGTSNCIHAEDVGVTCTL